MRASRAATFSFACRTRPAAKKASPAAGPRRRAPRTHPPAPPDPSAAAGARARLPAARSRRRRTSCPPRTGSTADAKGTSSPTTQGRESPSTAAAAWSTRRGPCRSFGPAPPRSGGNGRA
ncbi:hypothetical protein ACP70R_019083 [Stipagrostis hirtigluma subsp. patula]